MQPVNDRNLFSVPEQSRFAITADRRVGWAVRFTDEGQPQIVCAGQFRDPVSDSARWHKDERDGRFRVAVVEGSTNNWDFFGSRILSKNWTVQVWIEDLVSSSKGKLMILSLEQGKGQPTVEEAKPRSDEIFPTTYREFEDRAFAFHGLPE